MPWGTMRGLFTKLAVAVAVGFVGAYPFASTSGLLRGVGIGDYPDYQVIVISGIILFFLTLGLLGPAVQLLQKIVDTLGRTEERPAPNVAVLMLILGTGCAIAAMVSQYNMRDSYLRQISVNAQGVTVPQGISMQTSGSLGLEVLPLLTFLLGASLIGLGVWASLRPAPMATRPVIKPMVPELDDVSA